MATQPTQVSGFRLGCGLVVGVFVGLGIMIVGCPMMMCGGLGAVGMAASEADAMRQEREASERREEAVRQEKQAQWEASQANRLAPDPSNAMSERATPVDRGIATSAKAALSRLVSAAANDLATELDEMGAFSVRWGGSIARVAKKNGNKYDLIARCEGVRVRCIFDKQPGASVLKLKQKSRVAVYGKVSGIESDPKHGLTIILSADKVNRTRARTQKKKAVH